MVPDGFARITGGREYPKLSGEARFYQKGKSVLVEIRVSGLPGTTAGGFFALHIHEGSRCRGMDFSEAGSHFNPEGVTHPDHAGDLPPLLSCGGSAYLAVCTDRFRVSDIIGRTIVIHGRPDDFMTQPAGNAGHRIACGMIQAGA